MLRYLARRILLTVPTLLLVALAVFTLVRLVPGDPAQVMLGEGADAATVAAMHHHMGLDRPLPVQFLSWLGHIARGDLGTSIRTGQPVATLILESFKVTSMVVLAAMLLATVIAICAGLIAAWRRDTPLDLGVLGAASLVMAVPSFWLGLILLLVFALKLGWFPVLGYVSFSRVGLRALWYLALPIATLTISECGVLTRMMRSSSMEVLRLDYVTHARAKGLPERTVLLRHVFPNAFAPTLTLIGLSLGHLLGGIAVIETVFTLPGLGRLLVESILARDYPVVQGCLLFTAGAYIVINLIVDLCYPLFDPRVAAP
jgi:peptide/nickel transport system permease protein